jgi:hypothetical protein
MIKLKSIYIITMKKNHATNSLSFIWILGRLIIFPLLFINMSLFSQTLINGVTYRFNAANTGPVGIVATQLIGPNSDDVASAVTNIGFDFWFAGTKYTQFSVDENGLMKLGNTPITPEPVNNMASATNLPKIAAYWDDLATGTNGSVSYYLSTAAAPNRVLYVNWNVTVPKNTAGAANAVIQAQLYEATGSIHFAFGPTYPAVNAAGYTMGVGASETDFVSVTVTGTTFATAAYGSPSKDNNTMAPGSGSVKRYQFGTDYTAPAYPTVGAIPNAYGTGNRTTTVRITDLTPYNGTGVPLSGILVPRIYYKKTTDLSYVSTPGVNQTGTGIDGTWLFTIDHSLLPDGAANPGDRIQYFITAQDQSNALGHPNISSYPVGVVATDVNTITTPPVTPSSYVVGSEFTGIKTVGTGGDYASLTLAGGIFEQINAGQLSGNLTINIISDLTGETGLIALNAWANGPGGPFTVTINPVGNRTIMGSGAIKLNGTQSTTIDGLNDGANSLIINSTGAAISLMAGASNNTVTRTTVKGYVSSGSGVITVSNTTVTPCNNNIISYCTLSSSGTSFFAYQGICFTGASSTGTGNIVDNNVFTNFGYAAIHKEYTTTSKYVNFTISNNEIYNTVASSERNYFKGIWLESTTGNSSIFNNKIHDLLATFNTMSGTGIWAINTSNTAGDVTNIYNNVIYLDATANHPMQSWFGISVANAGTSNIHYNSIYIGGSSTNSSLARGIEKTAVGTADIRNNVVYLARTGSVNTALSLAGTYTQTNNYTADPGFTSPTNLLPDINNPNSSNLENKGVPIATISSDILGNTRSTTLPTLTDIGAYEFTIPIKVLNLNVFLEGLYNGSGAMNQAADATGPHWPEGVADHITVELHDAANYATIVHTVNDAALGTDGTITLNLPVSLNGSYYVTIKHRNSIETTTPTAKSFAGGIINHDFTTAVTQAYGENLKLIGGVSVIFSGDVNQDGAVDTGDMIPVDNDSFNYLSGYLISDLNGDGSVDTADMIFIDNNSANYIGTQHP